jgi:hypothetical protein
VDADSDVEELPTVEATTDVVELEGWLPHAETLNKIAEISTSCRRIFTPNPPKPAPRPSLNYSHTGTERQAAI